MYNYSKSFFGKTLEELNFGDIENFFSIEREESEKIEFKAFHNKFGNFNKNLEGVIRGICADVLDELGSDNDPLFRIARKLEQIALEDEYFIERKLFPNVDFYSGIILKAIGIPTSLFTVIFATGRTPGWIAHWHEMLSNGYRIGRPRQLYKGHPKRDYPD